MYQKKLKKTTVLLSIIFIQLSFSNCRSFFPSDESPNVSLTYQQDAYKYSILVQDEKIPVRILKPEPLPYTDNAHATVWIGRNFPYEKGAELIFFAKNYYKGIKYIGFFERKTKFPKEKENYQLRIGAATEEGLKADLKPWSAGDFEALKNIKSNQEFQELILSHYKNSKPGN